MSQIILRSNIANDDFTEFLYKQFDIQNKTETVTVVPMIQTDELEQFEWNIGVILGNSGSGKSTVLHELAPFVKMRMWEDGKPLISLFPNKTPDEVCELYFGLGLCSVPTLLRTPRQLSNGEKARFDLAWKIGNAKDNTIIYFDEFTSVVNRDVAKSMSYSLQRYVRKHNIKIVLASCHFDIIQWLQPDWIFNLNKQVDGQCELEHIVFNDDANYSSYMKINEKEILSDAKDIVG